MKSQKLAYKYALIAIFFWSTVATAFKVALEYLKPFELVFYASITSTLILLTIIIYQKKINLVKIHIKNNFKIVLLLASINPFLYYLVLFEAYDILPAQEAQAINYTWALMLAFFSVIFLKQKLTISDIVAGIICYFGVLIISTKGEPFSLNFSNIDGVLLALLSTVLWSMYWIFNTKSKVDPVVGLFSNFLIATPILITYFIFTQDLVLPSVYGLGAAIYVGFFEMGFTFLFWLKAMQSAESTSKIANLIFISPFISLVFIYFIVGEQIYISTVVGLTTIIFGLIIQQSKLSK
ncbi:DMT family transporter [Poseidonibacter ostreae]|uniref:EamA family transporter n=1 Tax=Poseidonibacter ostreae TaxID=2654171 RepID=A0A6L4WWK2_9BACT|nr:DMT family transporter [Poseidonibacter ostreae]KAB7887971.1 EamA family transporter [Poseidonibacter ostreae]KAB7891110.1 EamA family transporter [Poseidonibacter ostreae]KAB7892834.1 EamA family transporter [Poseidonibacter ostreae]